MPFRSKQDKREWCRQYRVKNADKISAYKKAYFKANRAKYYAYHKKWKDNLVIYRQFMPAVEEFYKEARRLTEETGVLHVVDHYWPINGRRSCGLHVPWNLRVITGVENDSKGNNEPEDHWSSVLEDMEK